MEVLKLQTNVPVQVAFKYPTGKPCDGLSGPQKMFTLIDGRILFLSVPAAERIEQQLGALGVGIGDVDICKAEVRNGNRKGIEYQVKRVNPPAPQDNGANGVKPPAPPTPVSQPAPRSDGQSNGNATNGHAANGNGAKSKLGTVLCEVIDACHQGRQHAKDIGYEMPVFNGDEIVRMVNTVMIQNGGSR
jgi:hypothetical protein